MILQKNGKGFDKMGLQDTEEEFVEGGVVVMQEFDLRIEKRLIRLSYSQLMLLVEEYVLEYRLGYDQFRQVTNLIITMPYGSLQTDMLNKANDNLINRLPIFLLFSNLYLRDGYFRENVEILSDGYLVVLSDVSNQMIITDEIDVLQPQLLQFNEYVLGHHIGVIEDVELDDIFQGILIFLPVFYAIEQIAIEHKFLQLLPVIKFIILLIFYQLFDAINRYV